LEATGWRSTASKCPTRVCVFMLFSIGTGGVACPSGTLLLKIRITLF
jgi:hypothetical protein